MIKKYFLDYGVYDYPSFAVIKNLCDNCSIIYNKNLFICKDCCDLRKKYCKENKSGKMLIDGCLNE